MALSPNKYVSNYTTCTSHRGVEAKDVEPANQHLDVTTPSSSQLHADCSEPPAASQPARSPPPAPVPDDSASYLQVVVEKHRRRREVAARPAQTSPRLPSASSPLARLPPPPHQGGGGGGSRGVFVLPHPVLLACGGAAPLCPAAALQAHAHPHCARGARADSVSGAPRDAAGDAPPPPPHVQKKHKTWKIFGDIDGEPLDDEPERVEVYYFEQGGGAFLATGGGARAAWCERAARRPARLARAALRELLAAPALLLGAPLALLLGTQRAALVLARGAVAGAVQAASDYALKPALALLFNALLQPLLVFAGNVLRAARLALRPAAGALADALEPAARLLRAVRLVDVRLAPGARCAHCARCAQGDAPE